MGFIIYLLSFLKILKTLSVFNERNITLFIKKYKSMYNNFNIKNEIKIKRISEYYKNNIT
jgi:hypothetical protein